LSASRSAAAAARSSPSEGVDAQRARAIAEFVKVMDRRAKGRARRAAKARVAAAARRAEEDQSRDALNAVFDRFPAAVDITYYGNMLAAGANARAIRGCEFASDLYLAGRDLPDHMLDIASEVTARLVRICKAGLRVRFSLSPPLLGLNPTVELALSIGNVASGSGSDPVLRLHLLRSTH